MQTDNRYSPPQASVAEGLTTQQAKPKGVLVLQILAVLFTLLFIAGLGSNLWQRFERGEAVDWEVAYRWAWYLKRIAMMFASAGLVFLLQWRSQFARWSGVAWLAFVMIALAVGPAPNFYKGSAAQITEYFTVMAIAQPLLGLILYFAAFSKKARAYFRSEPKLPAPEAAASTPAPS